MAPKRIKNICFIAPSTCLRLSAKSVLRKTTNLLKRSFKVQEICLSPFLFSSDEKIDHVTASAEERSEEFKRVIREYSLIISVAGGTGAEDLSFKITPADYRAMRERRPLFMGFSDFTFLLSEIYYFSRLPVVYFPSLKLGKGNLKKIISLIKGEEIHYQGRYWLTPAPRRKFSGIPIGGNLSTFVNFLNRQKPPRFNWSNHVLFLEDIQIDVEDLHRLLAALRRQRVINKIKGIVIGSLSEYSHNSNYRKHQKEALNFIKNYLRKVIQRRRKLGRPLPILVVSNFGHNIQGDLMPVPIGGRVSISKSKKITFKLSR